VGRCRTRSSGFTLIVSTLWQEYIENEGALRRAHGDLCFTYLPVPCKAPVIRSNRTNSVRNPYESTMLDLLAVSFSAL